MTTLREAAQNVVEVWKLYGTTESLRGWMEILEAALAEPVQEPVALAWSNLEGTKFVGNGEKWKHKDCVVPLYTAPPQRKPPIADEALWEMWVDSPSDVLAFARRIEMWHGITGDNT